MQGVPYLTHMTGQNTDNRKYTIVFLTINSLEFSEWDEISFGKFGCLLYIITCDIGSVHVVYAVYEIPVI